MPKALIFTDLHIHAHKQKTDRLQDCLKVLDWCFEQAIVQECQYVLFLGDLFHERSKIDVLNYLRTFEIFSKYENHPIETYLLVGNHDMYHREHWDVNSIKPLSAFKNVHIVEKPSTLPIGNISIDFLPYTERPIEALKELKEGRKKKDLRLLLGHLAVHGAVLNMLYGTTADVVVEYDTGMAIVDPAIFDDWDMTLLGHYHGAQKLNKTVEYLGSPLQLSFGEAFQDKHILVLDLDTLEKTYITNDFSPKHYVLGVDDLPNYDLENSFLRVVVNDIAAKELVDIKLDLIKNKKVASFDFKQKEKKTEDFEVIEEARAILFKSDEMLAKWLDSLQNNIGLDKTKLLEIGKQITEQVMEDV